MPNPNIRLYGEKTRHNRRGRPLQHFARAVRYSISIGMTGATKNCKQISQETFNDVVKENVARFLIEI